MPAVLSAIFSAIYASFASVETYGTSLATIFPAMQNPNAINATSEMEPLEYVIGVGSGLQDVRRNALLIPFPFTSQGYDRSGANHLQTEPSRNRLDRSEHPLEIYIRNCARVFA